MGTTSIPDYPRGLTFEQVWAAIHADREALKASWEKSEREMQEIREEHRKNQKEIDRQFEIANKALGKLGNRLGEFVERMVEPNLLKKFAALGFSFSKVSRNSEFWYENQKLMEIDALLENGDYVMAVEAKTTTAFEDINEHIKRMKKLRVYADSKGDKRKYLGAVAGMVFNDGVKEYVLKCGLYVIEPIGNTFDIIAPEGKYKPREW